MAYLHNPSLSATHRISIPTEAAQSRSGSSAPAVLSILRCRAAKTRPARLALAVVLALGALWWYSGRQLAFPTRRWKYLPSDPAHPPPVHPTILDKLDALTRLDGIDPDDPDDAQPGPDLAPPLGDHLVTFEDAVPRVDRIPDVLRYPKQPQSQPVLPKLLPADKLDAVTCPGQAALGLPCSFILPGFVGEQETKAQIHLHQLALLALHLNRTLVLPQVSKSRMGTCYAYPFSLYYEPDSLDKLGVPTISFSDFLAWTHRRDPAPTAQVIAIANPKPQYEDGAIEIDHSAPPDSVPFRADRAFCLGKGKARVEWGRYSPLTIWGPNRFWQSEESTQKFGQSIVRTLTGNHALKGSLRPMLDKKEILPDTSVSLFADILVMDYEIRYPVFNVTTVPTTLARSVPLSPFSHFEYGSTWNTLAELVVEQLTPFVAVHWRQETLDTDILGDCGEALVDHLVELKKQWPDLKQFYLATDYPIEDLESGREGTSAHSGTFNKILTPKHHSVMRRFLKKVASQLKSKTGLQMTTFAKAQLTLNLPPNILEELANGSPGSATTSSNLIASINGRPFDAISGGIQDVKTSPIDLSDLDTGLLGIIDKGVAMRAPVFITGSPGRCAKESSFTRQIIQTRQENMDARMTGSDGGAGSQAGRDMRNVVDMWTV